MSFNRVWQLCQRHLPQYGETYCIEDMLIYVTYLQAKIVHDHSVMLGSKMFRQIKYLLMATLGCRCNGISNYLQIIVQVFVLGCKAMWGFLNSLFIAEDLGAFFFLHFRKFRCLRRRNDTFAGWAVPLDQPKTNQKNNQNLSNLIWTLT